MSAAFPILSPAATAVYDAINSSVTDDHLTNLGRAMWHGWGNGELTDDEANFLGSAIEKRRPHGHRTAPGFAKPIRRLAGRVCSQFTPRRCRRRLTDEERTKRRHRKRMLGGSSALPDTLRHHYTEGERAVLCIVAGEVKHHGLCALSIDEIADRAGVGRTTVQNAMHEARRLRHVKITERPQRGRKNLPNVVEITSEEWRAWIKRGPSAAHRIGSNFQKGEHHKDHRFKEEEREERGNRRKSARSGPRSRLVAA